MSDIAPPTPATLMLVRTASDTGDWSPVTDRILTTEPSEDNVDQLIHLLRCLARASGDLLSTKGMVPALAKFEPFFVTRGLIHPPPATVTFEEFLTKQGVAEQVDREEFYTALARKCNDRETPGRWKRLVLEDALHNQPTE